jgi:hypothetical protein
MIRNSPATNASLQQNDSSPVRPEMRIAASVDLLRLIKCHLPNRSNLIPPDSLVHLHLCICKDFTQFLGEGGPEVASCPVGIGLTASRGARYVPTPEIVLKPSRILAVGAENGGGVEQKQTDFRGINRLSNACSMRIACDCTESISTAVDFRKPPLPSEISRLPLRRTRYRAFTWPKSERL